MPSLSVANGAVCSVLSDSLRCEEDRLIGAAASDGRAEVDEDRDDGCNGETGARTGERDNVRADADSIGERSGLPDDDSVVAVV